jgi:hypothetical protein
MIADVEHSACSQVGENTKSAQATKNLNIERDRRQATGFLARGLDFALGW